MSSYLLAETVLQVESQQEIEQDADVVMLLRREGDQPNELLVVDVAKNRHGQVGEVELAWDGSFSRALDLGEGV